MRAVVLVGGRGTRMGRLTDAVPKPMLPVGPMPLVAHQLRWLRSHGIEQVVLATGYRGEAFAELEPTAAGWGMRLAVVHEPRPAGTGGALQGALQAMDVAPGESVLVTNGDLLTGHDLSAQLRAAASDRAVVHVREVPDGRPYGRVDLDGERIVAFREKPVEAGASTVNAGTYVLSAESVWAAGPISSLERELFPRLAGEGQLYAYREPVTRDPDAPPAEAYFRDVGSPESLLAASVDAVRGLLPAGRPVGSGQAHVHPGARCAADALISGGSAVHEGAVVGERARVLASVVMPGARVAAGALVENAIVLADGTRMEFAAAAD